MLKQLLCVCLFFSVCHSVKVYKRQYKYVEKFDAYYKVHKGKSSFSNAVTTCKAEGSKLFIPTSKEEIDEILKLTDSEMELFWIGIHDIYSEGDFVALYNTPIEDVYINWNEGEPSNVQYANNSYDEDCVVFDRNGMYNDVPCQYSYLYICKKEHKELTLNEDCESYDSGYEYYYDFDRCYKFHNEPVNWHEAYKICEAEESYLAIINSKSELKIFIDSFALHPDRSPGTGVSKNYIHVGFNDLINNGEYLTINGVDLSDVGYEEWDKGEPYNNENKHCGCMKRDGSLAVADCNTKAMFLCEKPLSGGVN